MDFEVPDPVREEQSDDKLSPVVLVLRDALVIDGIEANSGHLVNPLVTICTLL
jgi:hypothetical protein